VKNWATSDVRIEVDRLFPPFKAAVVFVKIWTPNLAGYKEIRYARPTKSSLRRVMRFIEKYYEGKNANSTE
jgi:hypothetical protein